MEKLPKLTTLDDVVAFWESHDSAAYWDDMTEVAFDVHLFTNLLHPRLITITRRPEHCPRCQQPLDEVSIEYVTWNSGHLVMIRDVMALRCQASGHEYILEETLDHIERLLQRAQTQQLTPTEILQVPVFRLSASV